MARRSETPEATRATVTQAARRTRSELRARGEDLVARAVALRERIARDFWELGRVLIQLRDEDVHGALGFERLEDLLDQRLGLARSSAWKLMAIAESLPRAEAVQLGQEKAYALVTYTRVAPPEDDLATLVRSDAPIGGKPLSQASVRDVLSAAAAARTKRPRSLAERAQAKDDRALIAHVRARLAEVGVPVRAVRLHGDRVVVELTRRQAQRF